MNPIKVSSPKTKRLLSMSKSLDEAKAYMKTLNVVIYGTIRDIEQHFFPSFTNLDIITSYFNSSVICILENDSKDRTRTMLETWWTSPPHSPNLATSSVKKRIILRDNLDKLYPLRAHRLAYCRNELLNSIKRWGFTPQNGYSYAIHCDLDDRFWAVDFESICSCFRYDTNLWDVMTCVNQGKSYYDYWALRCDESWFQVNIFSCATNGVDFTTKIGDFKELLQKTDGLLRTQSSFNGLGIYKMSTLFKCGALYDADYCCTKCKNTKIGCLEDNDHIGLHNAIVKSGGNIFINVDMNIQTRPDCAENYQVFLDQVRTIKNVKKNPLLYLLIKEKLVKPKKGNGLSNQWISVGVNKYEGYDINNTISNYLSSEENLLVVEDDIEMGTTISDSKKKALDDSTSVFYINSNIKVCKSHNSFSTLFENVATVSFINFNSCGYHVIKKTLPVLLEKINKGTIVNFQRLINFVGYDKCGIKALYEICEEHKIKFKWLCTNQGDSQRRQSILNNNCCAVIKIVHNPLFVSLENFKVGEKPEEEVCFDWHFYTSYYDDLHHVKTKKDAWYHWRNFGEKEKRIYHKKCIPSKEGDELQVELKTKTEHEKRHYAQEQQDQHTDEFDKFDWVMYTALNDDLQHLCDKHTAWKHWYEHGKQEHRLRYFDWLSYIVDYNLDKRSNVDCKAKAIEHWKQNGMPQMKKYTKSGEENSDEFKKKEININTDNNDNNDNNDMDESENHSIDNNANEDNERFENIDHDDKEKEKDIDYDDVLFDWKFYVSMHEDLYTIKTPKDALHHWRNHGKSERRCCHNFNWVNYLSLNPDLIDNGVSTKAKAIAHWIEKGKSEGRLYL